MNPPDTENVRLAVLDHYRSAAGRARTAGGGCCGPACTPTASQHSRAIGYSAEDISSVPEGANLGLGCGNPHVIASLKPGEKVLDLGAGGGFDCFLAARQVGPDGQVIGVDMTPEMVALARANAVKAGIDNTSFRLGEIEHLPVADASVDVIISNCVINLSPDKQAVYGEAFRVLRPGGRLAISDVVAHQPLPEALRSDLRAWASCASGASSVDELTSLLHEIGFDDVRINLDASSRELIRGWSPIDGLENLISAAMVVATKPIERKAR